MRSQVDPTQSSHIESVNELLEVLRPVAHGNKAVGVPKLGIKDLCELTFQMITSALPPKYADQIDQENVTNMKRLRRQSDETTSAEVQEVGKHRIRKSHSLLLSAKTAEHNQAAEGAEDIILALRTEMLEGQEQLRYCRQQMKDAEARYQTLQENTSALPESREQISEKTHSPLMIDVATNTLEEVAEKSEMANGTKATTKKAFQPVVTQQAEQQRDIRVLQTEAAEWEAQLTEQVTVLQAEITVQSTARETLTTVTAQAFATHAEELAIANEAKAAAEAAFHSLAAEQAKLQDEIRVLQAEAANRETELAQAFATHAEELAIANEAKAAAEAAYQALVAAEQAKLQHEIQCDIRELEAAKREAALNEHVTTLRAEIAFHCTAMEIAKATTAQAVTTHAEDLAIANEAKATAEAAYHSAIAQHAKLQDEIGVLRVEASRKETELIEQGLAFRAEIAVLSSATSNATSAQATARLTEELALVNAAKSTAEAAYHSIVAEQAKLQDDFRVLQTEAVKRETDLTEQVATLRAEIALHCTTEKTVQAAAQAIAKHSEELICANEAKETAEAAYHSIVAEQAKLQDDFRVLQTEAVKRETNLTEQVATLRAEIALHCTTEKTVQAAAAQATARLTEELANANEATAKAEAAYHSVAADHTKLQDEFRALQMEAAKQDTELNGHFTQATARLTEELAIVNAAKSTAEAAYHSIVAEQAKLQDDFRVLQTEAVKRETDLTEQIATLRAEIASRCTTEKTVQAAAQATARLTEELAIVNEAKSTAEAAYHCIVAEQAKLQDDFRVLQTEAVKRETDLTEQIATLQAEIALHCTTDETMQAAAAQATATLTEELAIVNAAKSTAEAAYHSIVAEQAKLQDDFRVLQTEAVKRETDLTEQVATLQAEIALHCTTDETMQAAAAQAFATHAEELAIANEAKAAAEAAYHSLAAEQAKLQDEIRVLQAEVTNRETELIEQVTALRSEIALHCATRESVAAATEQALRAEMTVERLSEELCVLRFELAKRSDLEKDFLAMRERDALATDREQLEAELITLHALTETNLTERLVAAEQKSAEIQVTLQHEIHRLNSEIETLHSAKVLDDEKLALQAKSLSESSEALAQKCEAKIIQKEKKIRDLSEKLQIAVNAQQISESNNGNAEAKIVQLEAEIQRLVDGKRSPQCLTHNVRSSLMADLIDRMPLVEEDELEGPALQLSMIDAAAAVASSRRMARELLVGGAGDLEGLQELIQDVLYRYERYVIDLKRQLDDATFAVRLNIEDERVAERQNWAKEKSDFQSRLAILESSPASSVRVGNNSDMGALVQGELIMQLQQVMNESEAALEQWNRERSDYQCRITILQEQLQEIGPLNQ